MEIYGAYPVGCFRRPKATYCNVLRFQKKKQYLNLKLSTVNENFIYGNIKEQQMIVNMYSEVLEVREKLKQQEINLPSIEGPVHLDTSSVATLL